MPYSIVHLKLAKKKNDSLKICKTKQEELDFFVWNIFVDSSHELKTFWINLKRDDTHYYKWQNYFNFDFPWNFLKQEIIKNNFFNLWYYYHLKVDELWRDIFFTQKIFLEWKKTDFSDSLYHVFRKYYAFLDYKDFEKNNKNLILDLYKYKINKEKIPKIFKNIDLEILQKSYLQILDYMFFKDIFQKKDELKYLKIKDDKIFIDEEIKKVIEKYYPIAKYKDFYKKALEI